MSSVFKLKAILNHISDLRFVSVFIFSTCLSSFSFLMVDSVILPLHSDELHVHERFIKNDAIQAHCGLAVYWSVSEPY